jgi:hypothetical protein
MELPPDSYFEQPRIWLLTVYDHEGAATRFRYRVHGDSIVPAEEGEPAWTTEIPMAKLYAGLALGESLTSMYMRINDCLVNEDILQADVVDDPLIRCLFDGAVGAYQAAQLNRLQGRS